MGPDTKWEDLSLSMKIIIAVGVPITVIALIYFLFF